MGGSLLGPTLFLIFINDLPLDIVSSLNMYADDTAVYGQTSKTCSDTVLAVNLTSDLEHVVEWGKSWLVSFNSSKTKLLSFHHRKGSPSFPLFKWLKPLSMKLHALTGFWVSNSLQILSGIHTFFLLPKKQERWLVLSLEPGISLHLLLFTISTRAKSVRGWSTVVTFGLALPKAPFPVWIECKVECVGS